MSDILNHIKQEKTLLPHDTFTAFTTSTCNIAEFGYQGSDGVHTSFFQLEKSYVESVLQQHGYTR